MGLDGYPSSFATCSKVLMAEKLSFPTPSDAGQAGSGRLLPKIAAIQDSGKATCVCDAPRPLTSNAGVLRSVDLPIPCAQSLSTISSSRASPIHPPSSLRGPGLHHGASSASTAVAAAGSSSHATYRSKPRRCHRIKNLWPRDFALHFSFSRLTLEPSFSSIPAGTWLLSGSPHLSVRVPPVHAEASCVPHRRHMQPAFHVDGTVTFYSTSVKRVVRYRKWR
jgi:hypothetical protein